MTVLLYLKIRSGVKSQRAALAAVLVDFDFQQVR